MKSREQTTQRKFQIHLTSSLSVLLRIGVCFAITSPAYCFQDFDALVSKVASSNFQIGDSSWHMVVEEAKQNTENSEAALSVLLIYASRNHDIPADRRVVLQSIVDDVLSNKSTNSHAAIACGVGLKVLLTPDQTSSVLNYIEKGKTGARTSFLSVAPFVCWDTNDDLEDFLVETYGDVETRKEFFDACMAAVEMGNCSTDCVVDLFLRINDDYETSPSETQTMFAIIKMSRVVSRVLKGPKESKGLLFQGR